MKQPPRSRSILVDFGEESTSAIDKLAATGELSRAAVVRLLVRHALSKNPTVGIVEGAGSTPGSYKFGDLQITSAQVPGGILD